MLAAIPLSLEECYTGVTRVLKVHRRERCVVCNGTGQCCVVCTMCNGKGLVGTSDGPDHASLCPMCYGKGQTETLAACQRCRGSGVLRYSVVIRATVRKGAVCGNEHDVDLDRCIPGVRVTIALQPHSTFTRRGNNLHARLSKCQQRDAYLGHLDGTRIPVSAHCRNLATLSSDTCYIIAGKGMPYTSKEGTCKYGNLYILCDT